MQLFIIDVVMAHGPDAFKKGVDRFMVAESIRLQMMIVRNDDSGF